MKLLQNILNQYRWLPLQDYLDAPQDVQKKVDSVVKCVKQLTEAGGSGDLDSQCTKSLSSETRYPKDFNLLNDNNEAVSFILSIEPVHENVQEILNETKNVNNGPRNPKAIFVMLPNFNMSELNKSEDSEGDESSDEPRGGRVILEEFLIEEESRDGTVNDDDITFDAEESDIGSGLASAQHP